jgi:hypothetical protein
MELDEQIARSVDLGGASPPHPEEMKADVELRIGERTVLTASARMTPAGLVTAGVMVASILLSAAALVRAARRQPRLW